MKKLSSKPKNPIISKIKKPLVIGTALIGTMNACIIEETIIGEPAPAGTDYLGEPPRAGSDYAGEPLSPDYELVGESPPAGIEAVGQPPLAGDEFIGAGDPYAPEYDMTVPLDIGLYQADQMVAGSEVNDMGMPTEQDFGVSDMGPMEPDAELYVGLPPEIDAGVDEPGGEEP